MNNALEKEIVNRINDYETPKRIALSKKYPFLKSTIIFFRCLAKSIQNALDFTIKNQRNDDFYRHIVARHQIELREKSKGVDVRLQENKIDNIKKAITKLNGFVINPGKTFSFWRAIGSPTYKNGYVNGRVYSNSRIIEGVGGGLCQLSTFLYWIFLHSPVKIAERHPHSIDVHPSPKQNIFSRSGATVLYNFFDLKVKNDFKYPIQLKIWIVGNCLKGQILPSGYMPENIHIREKNHCFIRVGNKVFQYNELYREIKTDGTLVKVEKITANFSQVLYAVSDEYIKENNYKIFDFSKKVSFEGQTGREKE